MRASVDLLEISAADATCSHTQQHFARANARHRHRLHTNVIHATIDSSMHCLRDAMRQIYFFLNRCGLHTFLHPSIGAAPGPAHLRRSCCSFPSAAAEPHSADESKRMRPPVECATASPGSESN